MSEIKRIQGMVRSIDQWLNMVPSVVATGSMAQVEYALVDAKTDIEALWLKVAALSSAAVAEREPVAWQWREGRSNRHQPDDWKWSKWQSGRMPQGANKQYLRYEERPLYLDPPPASELEAENARLKAELDCALIREGNEKHHAKIAHQNMNAEINARERTEARLADAMKALEPFAEIAGEAWADGSGWTNAACQNDRICDWFGPSAFHTARRVREGGKVDG